MSSTPALRQQYAKLSVYYNDADKSLRQIDSTIPIDPEGVTEEDVQRLLQAADEYFYKDSTYSIWPMFVLIRGGKA